MKFTLKNILIIILLIIFSFPLKSLALIEVDITRGNLNPLPVAVSPLSIDDKSKKVLRSVKKEKYW